MVIAWLATDQGHGWIDGLRDRIQYAHHLTEAGEILASILSHINGGREMSLFFSVPCCIISWGKIVAVNHVKVWSFLLYLLIPCY